MYSNSALFAVHDALCIHSRVANCANSVKVGVSCTTVQGYSGTIVKLQRSNAVCTLYIYCRTRLLRQCQYKTRSSVTFCPLITYLPGKYSVVEVRSMPDEFALPRNSNVRLLLLAQTVIAHASESAITGASDLRV